MIFAQNYPDSAVSWVLRMISAQNPPGSAVSCVLRMILLIFLPDVRLFSLNNTCF